MVFILPPEFYAPDRKELPVAWLDLTLGRGQSFLRSPRRRITSFLRLCTSRVISTVIWLTRYWSTSMQQLI
jgi:hypothetical protein